MKSSEDLLIKRATTWVTEKDRLSFDRLARQHYQTTSGFLRMLIERELIEAGLKQDYTDVYELTGRSRSASSELKR